MSELRFEDHYTEPRGPVPPQGFVPMLIGDERVVAIETVVDGLGYAAARVWVARGPNVVQEVGA